MKYLDTILNNSDVSAEVSEEIVRCMKQVDEQLKQLKIEFSDENAEMVFTNHLVALTKRILSKEFIPDLDDSLMEGVSLQAMQLSEELVKDLFESHGCEVNKSELFLVATHIQLYLENRKDGKNNE